MGDEEYEDFEIEIRAQVDGAHAVRVLRSPSGEAQAVMQFPFDELGLENQLHKVEIEMLRSRSVGRRRPSQQERAAEELGSRLYEALFDGTVLLRWERSREIAEQSDRDLRLKLRIEDPKLASVPWEFLFDKSRGEFVTLSTRYSLVRYLNLPQPRSPLPIQLPLKILGVVSSPDDLPTLDVEAERLEVAEALETPVRKGLVVLNWLPGQGWRDLQRAMAVGQWHVVHFIGHGQFDPQTDEGAVAMVGRDGRARAISATILGRLLADHKSLRLAVLNACEGARGGTWDIFSSASAILVRRGIPAVLAMQFEISDLSAIEFSRTFYTYLGEGFPVDRAVTEARKAMSVVAQGPEWGTPVLYMNTTSGRIFRVEESESSPVQGTDDGKDKPAGQGTTPDLPPSPGPKPEPDPRWWRDSRLVLAGLAIAALTVVVIGVAMLLNGHDPDPVVPDPEDSASVTESEGGPTSELSDVWLDEVPPESTVAFPVSEYVPPLTVADIDGDLDNDGWSNVAPWPITVFIAGGYSGTLSATDTWVKSVWGERGLFFAANIMDPDIEPGEPDDAMWTNDRVWLYLSTAPLDSLDGHTDGDVAINFAPDQEITDQMASPVQVRVWDGSDERWVRDFGLEELIQRVHSDRSQGESYAIEARIPWDVVDPTGRATPPAPGDVWAMAVLVTSSDNEARIDNGTLATFGSPGSGESACWGRILFWNDREVTPGQPVMDELTAPRPDDCRT